MTFKILFFGDIIGSIGRRGVIAALPDLRAQYAPDCVIANVENLAHGSGITAKTLLELDAANIDAYTSGNHVWQNKSGLSCFEDPRWKERLIRPANVDPKREGRGFMVLEQKTADATGKTFTVRVAVTNFLGQLFMKDEASSPFLSFDRIYEANKDADIFLVDMHTETTSEKEAFGHYADGRATAVFGTHTHVPTADQKILPGGTAYVTDVGRNGALDSVNGFEKVGAIKSFTDSKRTHDIPEHGEVEINCVLLTVDLETKKAVSLDRIRKIVDISAQ